MTSDIIRTKWMTYTRSIPVSMRGWARQLPSYEEIPPGFQQVFPKPAATPLPYTLLLPEERISLFHKQNARLLCLYEDRLEIFEAVRDNALSASYPLNAVISLEYGKILLMSWLKLHTASQSVTINFNSVTENLFKPVLDALRPAITAEDTRHALNNRQHVLSKLEFLRTINLKYFNMGIRSLVPGSKLLGFAYQPDIHLTTLNLFNKPILSKYLTCHLSLLTDNELILIKESNRTKGKKEALYGAIFTFIPYQQIARCSFEDTSGATDCVMTITCSDNTLLRSEFSRESAINLEDFKVVLRRRIDAD
jgi:hypothetical protein